MVRQMREEREGGEEEGGEAAQGRTYLRREILATPMK